MKNVRTFEKFLNESINEGRVDNGLEKELIDDFVFEVKAVKCKVHTDDDDPEDFRFDMIMSNGDKLSFESSHTSSPNPEDYKNDFDMLKINGKVFKLADDEENQNFYGVMSAYKRYLNK